jgi:predicted dehydrogenase
MAEKIRWGILGCGRIARKFASDLRLVQEAELIALGSRNIETAEDFAKEFPAKYIHDGYESLVQNDEVDVIYIATPHSHHYENTILCLNHNKAVLCEKAFAVNTKQAREMIDLACKKNVFLMEALWTKFLPHYNKMRELIQEGKIGEIKSVLVNFGFKPAPPVPPRLFDPKLAGGTLLDIGIYNVFIALSVLGKPDLVDAVMTPSSSGVDEQCAVTFKYNNGAIAHLFSTFSTNLATEADICGSKGRVRLTHRFYAPESVIEFYPDRVDSLEMIPLEKQEGWGYQHEARHVCECLKNEITESAVMTFADTLLLMETLDAIRQKAGIYYDVDE